MTKTKTDIRQRDDKDAVWLMELMEEGYAKLTMHSIKRIRAIARRLNGGKSVRRD